MINIHTKILYKFLYSEKYTYILKNQCLNKNQIAFHLNLYCKNFHKLLLGIHTTIKRSYVVGYLNERVAGVDYVSKPAFLLDVGWAEVESLLESRGQNC